MKIAIIGAAYTGMEAARYLKSQGHTITVTTTGERRVAELEPVSDRVIVMRGNDREKMRELLSGQDAVLMTVAGGMVEKEGKFVMDLDLYTDTYVGTAECLVGCLDAAPELKQIIFTGSWSVYGNAGGADHVDEDTFRRRPASPFQQVYADTENPSLLGVETDAPQGLHLPHRARFTDRTPASCRVELTAARRCRWPASRCRSTATRRRRSFTATTS